MQVTYYGHSCFRIEIEGKSIVFDPFITDNPLANDIHINDIPCDYMLISHGHGDHVGDAVHLGKLTGAKLISSFEICAWAEKQGINNYHPMNIGGQLNIGNITIKLVNAIHSSSFPDGSYAGQASGFIISTPNKTIYYAGDTALHMDMQLLGIQHNIDFSFLPIGDNFTMGIKDAIKASEMLQCDQIIGMHYDTFGYIKIAHDEAKAAFQAAQKQLTLFTIGETKTL